MRKADVARTGADLAARLQSLPAWAERDGAIERVYDTDGWPTTIMAVNAVAFLAEAADHHPELAVSWGRLVVRLNTHSAGGITDKDLELAALIERQLTWRAGDGALEGTGKAWIKQEPPAR